MREIDSIEAIEFIFRSINAFEYYDANWAYENEPFKEMIADLPD